MLAAARKYKRVVQVGMQRRSTPHLVTARDRIIREGRLGTVGLVEIYCYYHMRATVESARHAAAGLPRLRDVDRPRADAAVQRAGSPAQLAGVHGIRQRHHGRHVRAHARHGALDARPRHADPDQLVRRHPDRQGEQSEHHRHADRHLRLPDSEGRLDSSQLRRRARSEVPVGSDLLRRQGNAEGERDGLRLRAVRQGRVARSRGREVRVRAVSRKTRRRRISRRTWRRQFGRT